MKRKIIIDTDPGQDDALAILLLEKCGLFDIKALTTVAGNSSIENTTNNARYILDLVGSNTPIYSGTNKPLERELIQAEVHGKSGLGNILITKNQSLSRNASEKIIEIVKKNPEQITILTIGPLTNIARAFKKYPDLPSLIKEIVIMGGAITVPGNKNRVAEFNIFVDPEAASIVFDAPVKKLLIPLDVCNDVFFSQKDFERLKGSKLYNPIKEMMRDYIYGIKTFEKTVGAIMYDPLAAYYLINPKAFILEKMDIRVETKGELTRGMTVAERRIWGDKNKNICVATRVNRSIFKKDFFSILKYK